MWLKLIWYESVIEEVISACSLNLQKSALKFLAPGLQHHYREQSSRFCTPFKFYLLKTGFVNCLFCATIPVALACKEFGKWRYKVLYKRDYVALCTYMLHH